MSIIVSKNENHTRAQQRTLLKRKLGGNQVRKGVTLSSVESIKDSQIQGFITCLQGLLSRYDLTLCKDFYSKYFHKIYRKTELSQIPKNFKVSLATHFSRMTGQEVPENHSEAIDLFPQMRMKKLIFKTCHTHKKKLRFAWDLLQCKDLSNKVPKSMISQAYEKHWKTLTSVGESPNNVLTMIRPYFREFAMIVKNEFLEKSPLPPKSAYLNSKRSEEGCLGYFKRNNLLTSSIYERRSISNDNWRIDPVVIHITGKPGQGKSYNVEKISEALCAKFGLIGSNYQRSIATDHWDGYRNQLITTIDDIFSDPNGVEDQKQIIQICSNVPVVLPMADLREKGRKFNSDFLILTSNYVERTLTNRGSSVTNPDAFMRRIFPAYEILSYDRQNRTYQIQEKHYNPEISSKPLPGKILTLSTKDFIDKVVNDALIKHRERSRHDTFIVPVTNNGVFESNLGFKVPIEPPKRSPIVKAHAIPEPLKVRMITKAEEECWVLKPVQKAMWKALQHFRCFKLTGCPDIPLDFIDSWNGEFLLSGDYESATDNLNQDIMAVAVEELSKVLPSPYKEWLQFEASPHVVKYPEFTKLPDILQTRGQLMGSLLSFPILCVVNAACIGIIKKQDLDRVEALINGDDILFRESIRKINSWKNLVKSVGLKPSIGKNYCDRNFGSINSQLIYREHGKHQHLATGMFGAVHKTSNYLCNLQYALKIEPQHRGQHIKKAEKLLLKTPQSLDVPVSFGGLGIDFSFPQTKYMNKLINEIYFYKLFSEKCCIIREVDDSIIIRIPKHLYHQFKGVIQGKKYQELPDLEVSELDFKIFDFKKFDHFKIWYKKHPLLRSRISHAYLPREIPLNKIDTVVLKVHKDLKTLLENLRSRI